MKYEIQVKGLRITNERKRKRKKAHTQKEQPYTIIYRLLPETK